MHKYSPRRAFPHGGGFVPSECSEGTGMTYLCLWSCFMMLLILWSKVFWTLA